MALNARGSIDPRWIYHNRNAVRALELAQVEIYTAGDSGQVYNATTNTWTATAQNIYIGRARVQPIASADESAGGFNPTFSKVVRVQISYGRNEITGATEEMPDIRPNQKMRITSSPYNETLTNFIYIVTDVLNSSNAWERTLLCKVDTELDPTSTGA